MSEFHRRVIVDAPFDRTLWLVIETLVRDGFTIKTSEGNPPHSGVRRVGRKHVLLEATHSHVTAEALKAGLSLSMLLPCRLAVYELSAHQTAVVVPDAVAWDADDRITRALDAVANRHVPCMAVA